MNLPFKRDKKIAILGATGLVGLQLIKVLERRNFPVSELRLFASQDSIGKPLLFHKRLMNIQPVDFSNIDIAFFATDGTSSKKYYPAAKEAGCVVIDKSSAFRMDPLVPLVIPEINGHEIAKHRGIIASPNCTTSLLALPLFPLHTAFQIKRIVVATYQAASGGGKKQLQKLLQDAKESTLDLFPHDSALTPNGYVEEEVKMKEEAQKIMRATFALSATCVRVPVIRAHSLAINVEFHLPFTLDKVYEILHQSPGITVYEDRVNNRFATPLFASEKEEVFCGRLRCDASHANTLEMWVVGDQLLKGAALNAVQIAEYL